MFDNLISNVVAKLSMTQDESFTSTDQQGARPRRRHKEESATVVPKVHSHTKPVQSSVTGIVDVVMVLSGDSQV